MKTNREINLRNNSGRVKKSKLTQYKIKPQTDGEIKQKKAKNDRKRQDKIQSKSPQ